MKKGIKTLLSLFLAFSMMGQSLVFATDDTEGEKTSDPIVEEGNKSDESGTKEDTAAKPENTNLSTDLTKNSETSESKENEEAPQVNYVAKIGEDNYESISDALNALKNGGEIVLIANVTEDVVVDSGKTVVLNLNGNSITNVSGDTIYNKGTLTIKGSGTVDNVSHQKAAIHNEVGATAILEDGTYTRSKENGNSQQNSGGNSFYNVLNHGTMTINSGVNIEQSGSFSSLIENGWYSPDKNTTAASSTLTINGGTFIGGKYTIKNDDYGVMTINDGTFINVTVAAVLNWNKLTIKGGQFSSQEDSIYNGYAKGVTYETGELTIEGGTFTSVTGINDHGGSYKFSGGSFSQKPKDEYMVEGYAAYSTENVYKVLKQSTSITLSSSTLELEQYAESSLTATYDNSLDTVEWSSSNTGVATVDNDGKVTAVKTGTATITAKIGNATATCEVTVKVKEELGVETDVVQGEAEVNIEKSAEGIVNKEDLKDANVDLVKEAQTLAQDQNVITEEVKNLAEEELKGIIGLDGKEIKIVVQPYLDLNVLGYSNESGQKVLKLDITPKYNLIATTTDVDAGNINTAEQGNAVVLENQGGEMTVTQTTEVTVPVGNLITDEEEKDSVFVEHYKNGKLVGIYKATYDKGEIIFTNPHGFSEFKVIVDVRTASISFKESNKVEDYRLNNIGDKLPEAAAAAGYTFEGWSYKGKVYTSLTKELFDAITATDDSAAELTAVFKKVIVPVPVETTDNNGNVVTYVVPNTADKGE